MATKRCWSRINTTTRSGSLRGYRILRVFQKNFQTQLRIGYVCLGRSELAYYRPTVLDVSIARHVLFFQNLKALRGLCWSKSVVVYSLIARTFGRAWFSFIVKAYFGGWQKFRSCFLATDRSGKNWMS